MAITGDTNQHRGSGRPLSLPVVAVGTRVNLAPPAQIRTGSKQLRATAEQLCDALGACTELNPVYRRLLKMALEQLQFLEQQIGQLDQDLGSLLHPHQDAVQRLAEVPGLGVDSATQIIAEVGATAGPFLRTSNSPRGWAPAPATTRAPA